MVRTLSEATAVPGWREWESIRCPALVVRAEKGVVAPEIAREMTERPPRSQLIEMPEAGHDLHLDQPDQWRPVPSRFLDSLDGRKG
jgi:pimeloyl-ACP methyl ester carboxylesterase